MTGYGIFKMQTKSQIIDGGDGGRGKGGMAPSLLWDSVCKEKIEIL